MGTWYRVRKVHDNSSGLQIPTFTTKRAESVVTQTAPAITAQRMEKSQPVGAAEVLGLQRLIGNRAVQGLLEKRLPQNSQDTSTTMGAAMTAPEAPTNHADSVQTETQGWDPAPGVLPPSPPAPLTPVERDYCRTTGSFSSIPSGVVSATMTGTKLGATFNMVGDFDSPLPCNCTRGEYRQYVRGTFTSAGTPVTHHMGPGVTLHPTNFQLDGNSTTANYFGRRDYRTSYSHFEPDQAGGCQFQGQDIPGISGASGTALTVNLDFQGKLIDTGNSNHTLAFGVLERSRQWYSPVSHNDFN
jgi:hypothetical protein